MHLEEWHLRYFFASDEVQIMMESEICLGRTLLSDKGAPLGFGGVYTQPNEAGQAVPIAFFYGGPNEIFVRKYPKLALRGMAAVFRDIARLGARQVYALADKRIEKALVLVKWLGGVPTGHSQEEGDLFVFDPRNTPLSRYQE